MKNLIWVLVVLLVVLHQDNWNWLDSTLHLGFLPTGLLYHACLSVACSAVWLMATQFAWPAESTGEIQHEQENVR